MRALYVKSVVHMDGLDQFLSIAEISGIFLGFAVLISLVDRSEGEQREHLTFLITNLVFACLLIITASMMPLVLYRYGLVEGLVWAISAGIVFSLNIVIVMFMSRLTKGWKAAHRRSSRFSFVIWSLEPFFQFPLIFCVLGLWHSLSLAFYLTAMVATLLQTALLLANLVVSSLEDEADV